MEKKKPEVHFNMAWVASKSFEDFLAHEGHHGLKEEELRKIYDEAVANNSSSQNEAKGKRQGKSAAAGKIQ